MSIFCCGASNIAEAPLSNVELVLKKGKYLRQGRALLDGVDSKIHKLIKLGRIYAVIHSSKIGKIEANVVKLTPDGWESIIRSVDDSNTISLYAFKDKEKRFVDAVKVDDKPFVPEEEASKAAAGTVGEAKEDVTTESVTIELKP